MTDDAHQAWRNRYGDWLAYVRVVEASIAAGRELALGPGATPLVAPPVPAPAAESGSRVLYCAPHPDDESLSGALALRLRLESGAPVTNVAVTLGSDTRQRARRLRELESACRALGFGLLVAGDDGLNGAGASGPKPAEARGFDHVNLKGREDREAWGAKVEGLRRLFDREQPDLVFTPHADDFNSTHIGTHHLVIEALGEHLAQSGRAPVLLIETEFWHQIERPNLMVALSPETVAAQLVAVTEHGDEMRRNPYHLLHPCRLMDNVRRGSEVVCDEGAAAQKFSFAELYRVRWMRGVELLPAPLEGQILAPGTKASVHWLHENFRARQSIS